MTAPLALDLYAGTGSATDGFVVRGWRRIRVESDVRFDADYRDVLTLDPEAFAERHGLPTFIWASPPCTAFSVGSFRHHFLAATSCRTCGSAMRRSHHERWWHAYNPDCTKVAPGPLRYTAKSPTGEAGLVMLRRALDLITALQPRWWVVENPRALMRKMPELADVERRTITHCQYGDPRRMKPTDLWGVFPPGFEARACKNGDPCHEAAPRGARTGTQGLTTLEAGMLPPMLGAELCEAIEAEDARCCGLERDEDGRCSYRPHHPRIEPATR